ncbi:hypothetical protein Q4506_09260 [Colwellia sp. 4_MG-2023]|nr:MULTISPECIES: hypothetical protein [unclassified Colwellia]MDO6507083.1 hypothetical protein [Colwellia sp. 5_MG-2023]MDO6555871.1 hypothetical protein [Colwellia sp. 4_MG-2023]
MEGKITKPMFSFPGGLRFQLTDSYGNESAVWAKASESFEPCLANI